VTTGRAASVHARLLARAKQRGEDFNLILGRYAVERFLYRLSISNARENYWLKGALLFDLWFEMPHRPTRDADLLGFGSGEIRRSRVRGAGECPLASSATRASLPRSHRA